MLLIWFAVAASAVALATAAARQPRAIPLRVRTRRAVRVVSRD